MSLIKEFDEYILRKSHLFYFLPLIFIITFFLFWLRRPDALLYAQFWAEDGARWFSDAYNMGLRSLIIPHTGYFQTFSRLIGNFSQLFPIAWGPYFFNFFAICIRVLPVLILFSKRFDKVFPSYSARLFLSLIYILLPNTAEVHSNITNAHWFLAISSFLIIISEQPKKLYGKVFDHIFIIVAVLSGPFGIFLLPSYLIRLIVLYKKKDNNLKYFCYLFIPFVICIIIQITSLALTSQSRVDTELGATLMTFIKLITGQIYIASLVGGRGYAYLYNHILNSNQIISTLLYVLIFFSGSFVLLYTAIKAKVELKLFLLFSAILLFFSLYKPMGSVSGKQWEVMTLPFAAARYYVIPMLAFLLSLIFVAKSWYNIYILRIIPIAVLLMFSIGVMLEFSQPAWPNLNHITQSTEFDKAKSGQTYYLNIMPQGWRMKLIKK